MRRIHRNEFVAVGRRRAERAMSTHVARPSRGAEGMRFLAAIGGASDQPELCARNAMNLREPQL